MEAKRAQQHREQSAASDIDNKNSEPPTIKVITSINRIKWLTASLSITARV